mgnify:CR=1 FL=1
MGSSVGILWRKRAGYAFCAVVGFSLLYNAYKYYFLWNFGSPNAPLYISLLKDLPWLLTVLFTAVLALKSFRTDWHNQAHQYRVFSATVVLVGVSVIIVALFHLGNKSFVDVLQRDCKNLQYLIIPFLLPFIFDRDAMSGLSAINILLGVSVCANIVGFLLVYFLPDLMNGAAPAATFTDHYAYGYVMFVAGIFSASLFFSGLSPLFYTTVFISSIGGILLSTSVGGLGAFFIGISLLLLVVRPPRIRVLKLSGMFAVAALLFYLMGLYDPLLAKFGRSVTGYRSYVKSDVHVYTQRSNKRCGYDLLAFFPSLDKPYSSPAVIKYDNMPRDTSIAGRAVSYREMQHYLSSASPRDILLGDFSIHNFCEYDSYYLVLLRNGGVVSLAAFLAVFFFWLWLMVRRFLHGTGNMKPAVNAIFSACAVVLLTSYVALFNLAIFPIIYPISLLLYLMFFGSVYIAYPPRKSMTEKT